MSTGKRRSFLDKILGRDSAKVIETAMADMKATLDKKGVDRKEYDVEKVKGVLEDTVEAIETAIAPLSENIPEGIGAKILALVMGSLSEISEPEIVEDVETMQEDEEDEEVPEALMELTESVTNLAKESLEANKDMRELTPHFVTMAKAVDSLAPLVEEAQRVKGLEKRIKTLEGKINLRPRAASTAKATVTTDNGAVETELKKGLDGQKTVLGVPVKG